VNLAAVAGESATTPLGTFPISGVPDGRALAVFRPETVRISDDDDAVHGRVETSFFRGAHFLLVVSLGGGAQRVLVRSRTRVAPGTQIALQADEPAFVRPVAARSETK